MKRSQPKFIAGAMAVALAAGTANAALERMGPVSRAPTIGGYPSWFQDKTGITLEFCDLKSQAELDGGWCGLIPPGLAYPENFPNAFFDEHFYYAADNTLTDASVPGGFKARLVMAIEAAFANGDPVDGDQMTFGRHRVSIPTLPYDGDYRVITPFSDVTYFDQKAGDRLFVTSDIGVACINTFECTLGTVIGPYLLPSPVAGGAEVPPMPDLQAAPIGTDPFYDLLVANAATTPNPGTGRKYIADPGRIGPVTGSPLPGFTAYNRDGSTALRNHNTFRIEVRAPSPNHDGAVIYAIDGENNFTAIGRLLAGAIPGKTLVQRASYKADSMGNVTGLDVFATASTAMAPRIPAQAQAAGVSPILSFYDVPCGGAISTDPGTGAVTVNPPPYSAPLGSSHSMAATDHDFWGQSQPGGKPPSHVCVEDATARNAAGQVVPAYYLKNVTDDVTFRLASFDGPANGTLTVNAVSSDPTATLTLAGYGPAPVATPGTGSGRGAGTGLDLAGNVATVSSLRAPPAFAQVVSSKGGAAVQPVTTVQGPVVMVGVPVAVNDNATVYEDCSATPAPDCATQGVVVDLLANDTILSNGNVIDLRSFSNANPASVSVVAQAPSLGIANLVNGMLTYSPGSNAYGADSITYTVSVDGKVSNPAALSITITPVNDAPLAVNDASAAVAGFPASFNLIAKATDPDGNLDVKNAILTSWPAGLGPQPVPVGGVISYTPLPTSAGAFTFSYQVVDASNLASANTATGTVTVAASEAINIAKATFVGAGKVGGSASTRWTVSGTDTVRMGQTLSIVYNDGLSRNGVNCNATPADPGCRIGTAVVDSLGSYKFDRVGTPGGQLDPNDKVWWPTRPSNIKVYSSAPVLGGSKTTGISFK